VPCRCLLVFCDRSAKWKNHRIAAQCLKRCRIMLITMWQAKASERAVANERKALEQRVERLQKVNKCAFY